MIGLLSAGNARGSRVITNAEACLTLPDMTPELIERQTGIRQRCYAAEGETVSTMALSASRTALERAGVAPASIGLTIVATFSHSYHYPAAAAKLHHDLGLKGGMFFDLQSNCTGFLNALIAAHGIMSQTDITHALVVGSEAGCKWVDPTDSGTAPYFADGAGAVVLGPSEFGIVSSAVYTDSDGYEAVRHRRDHFMEQQGSVTGRLAMQHLPRITREAMDKAGWTVDDVDTFVFHQANKVLVEFLAARLGVPMSKAPCNVEMVGNTGAASIPLLLGDIWPLHGKVVFAAVGAGFGFASLTAEFPR